MCQNSNGRNVWAPAGLVVGYPERLGGGDVPRRPDGAPVHGQQFWGLAHHGEGVHEGRDEDQGGRLSGRAAASTCLLITSVCFPESQFSAETWCDVVSCCDLLLHISHAQKLPVTH